MKRSRFSEELIIGILREQEAGVAAADVCRKSVARYERSVSCRISDMTATGIVDATYARTVSQAPYVIVRRIDPGSKDELSFCACLAAHRSGRDTTIDLRASFRRL